MILLVEMIDGGSFLINDLPAHFLAILRPGYGRYSQANNVY